MEVKTTCGLFTVLAAFVQYLMISPLLIKILRHLLSWKAWYALFKNW